MASKALPFPSGSRFVVGPVLLLSILVLSPVTVGAQGSEIDTKPIEKELICQCGCNMVVESCQCSVAEQIRADIVEKLTGGMTREQILAAYIEKYGRTVLAYPPKKGFDLTAWIMPFAAVLAGAAVLYILLRRWVRREVLGESITAATGEEKLDEHQRRLVERELKKYH